MTESNPTQNPPEATAPFNPIIWLNYIWDERPELSQKAVSVAMMIRSYCSDHSMSAWPSIETISRRTRLAQRTVQYAINELVEADLLQKLPRFDMKRQTSNEYRLQMPQGCTRCRGEGAGDAPSGVQEVHPELPIGMNQKEKDVGSGDPSRFEEWWKLYDVQAKGPKKQARDQWERKVRKQNREAEVISRTQGWFAQRKALRMADHFVAQAPHAHRFIRDERWADEIAAPPSSAARKEWVE